MKELFPHLSQNGKILMSVDDDKSHMYVMICRATTKETIQEETLQTWQVSQDRIIKNVEVTHRKSRKEKTNRKEIIKWQT